MPKNYFITTSIPYVNGEPHIGFAMEGIEGDTIARYFRMQGNETFFLTGTDENGVKIYKTAHNQGVETQELCDKYSQKFQDLKPVLNFSNDDFIRTTDRVRHWPAAQEMWKRIKANGDIYIKNYEGLYCEGCEAFLTEKELIDGHCPNHKKPPVTIAEENYFFKLSAYTEKLLEIYKKGEIEVVPEFRKNEIMSLLEEGLQDVSFSRSSHSLPWGVPVPDNEEQVMYVWCDALTNYISGLGFGSDNDQNFQKFWQNDQSERIHVIGKDIIRFHLAIWPAMLLAAGVNLPNKIFVHGFITSDGQKMSKSLGNVVDPFNLVTKYGTDSVRYYLLREIPVGRDGDFSEKHFEEIYNAHLANGLGNLMNRIAIMSQKNEVNVSEFEDVIGGAEKVASVWKKYDEKMNSLLLNEGVNVMWELVDYANKKMDEEKPWVLKKTDQVKMANVLASLVEVARHIGLMLIPIMPETAEKIRVILGLNQLKSIISAKEWRGESVSELGKVEALFPRIED